MSTIKPKFVVKNRFQKDSKTYRDILTDDLLKRIATLVTGAPDYEIEFVEDQGYNKGRLLKLYYEDRVAYISLSGDPKEGRNSALQSFPTAYLEYLKEPNPKKSIFCYLMETQGTYCMPYMNFMFRLLKTNGVVLLEEDRYFSPLLEPFITIDDIIRYRVDNRDKNKSNNSTYITLSPKGVPQIYGKTYGANKYETSFLTLAVSKLYTDHYELYEIPEKDLAILPEGWLNQLQQIPNLEIIPTDLRLDKRRFEEGKGLRSPVYIYNLFSKFPYKKCVMCDCDIPQIVQGAHVWPVSSIKKDPFLSADEKFNCAIDKDNGLWLCNNHHRLFDLNIITVTETGEINFDEEAYQSHGDYLDYITTNKQLEESVLTASFLNYLKKRNAEV